VQQRHDNVSDLLTMYNRKLHADGFVIVESGQISGEPIYTMAKIGLQLARQVEKYDVALSYAGEQQYYVEQIATMLRNAGVRVFYAPHEEAQLWGEDLVEAFEAVFLHGSRFVVMFVSADYERKAWPTVERRAAIERAISQKSAYILPVRFDDTSIPGLRGTVSYQEAARKTPAEIANLIIERLRT
jgi:hypothetical protein